MHLCMLKELHRKQDTHKLCDPSTLKQQFQPQNQVWALSSGFSKHLRRQVLSHFLWGKLKPSVLSQCHTIWASEYLHWIKIEQKAQFPLNQEDSNEVRMINIK